VGALSPELLARQVNSVDASGSDADTEELTMTPSRLKLRLARAREQGKVGWILLWLLGVPIPVLLVLFLLRGCT
jgi:hypothetical protein